MLDQLENALQFAVLFLCFIAAVPLAVRRKSRTWTLLAFYYGSWWLGDLYWLLCYLYFNTMPQISIVSDLSWYAAMIFLYMLLREVSPPEGKRRVLPWLGPVFTAGMAVFFMRWGEYLNNLIYAALMGLLLYAAILRLMEGRQRFLSGAILEYCLLGYGLWVSSCFWKSSVLTEPYYWFELLLTACFPVFLPAARKAGAE